MPQSPLFFLLSFLTLGCARDVIKLEAVNFELAITSYSYVAILFYDQSEFSKSLEKNWERAGELLGDASSNAELGKMNLDDPDMKEILDAYRLNHETHVKVFRRGTMSDYKGPYDAEGIAQYIQQDSKPSIKFLKSFEELKKSLKERTSAAVLGFFNSEDISDDVEDVYSLNAWGQFQAAADSLRGHAVFYVITSEEVMKEFDVDGVKLPVVYLVPEDGDGLTSYPGEILEVRLVEWILRNSPPSFGELTFSSTPGELYATQFFSSKLLKFILFLPAETSSNSNSNIIAQWKKISNKYKNKSVFSFIVGETVPDILEYFGVELETDVPLIVAHNPNRDYKYKSASKLSLSSSSSSTTITILEDFVSGVINGQIKQILKSEPIPKSQPKGSFAMKVVGSNVLNIVNDPKKDVLLEVYGQSCPRCQSLAPTYDILGKAFQGEDRVVIAKIDGSLNDLPLSWGVKTYPTILWFPASDKPYTTTTPTPKPYWDAGVSLHELVSFVVRYSSFDSKTLRVATAEQLSSLLGDEETLREQYEREDRWQRRNEGRKPFENALVDYVAGEVIFDGLRWHIALLGGLSLSTLGLLLYVIYLLNFTTKSSQNSKKKK